MEIGETGNRRVDSTAWAHIYGRKRPTRQGEGDRGKAAQRIAPLDWTGKSKIDGGWRKRARRKEKNWTLDAWNFSDQNWTI